MEKTRRCQRNERWCPKCNGRKYIRPVALNLLAGVCCFGLFHLIDGIANDDADSLLCVECDRCSGRGWVCLENEINEVA